MDLILKVKDTKTLTEQFTTGVKIRPDRLKDAEVIYVIKHDLIDNVYQLKKDHIEYNALKNTLKLNSILGEQIENHELLGKEVDYKTFNPATIKDIDTLLK